MRYFVPDIRASEELLVQTGPEDKFGGLPWGLTATTWPVCKDCGKSQSLLAQLNHHPERLDLGRQGRVLFVFHCNHDPGMCSTWEAGSGANACFVMEPEDLSNRLSPMPKDAPPIEHEVRVAGWLTRDDGLSDSLALSFFDEKRYRELDRDFIRAVTWSTRLGSIPRWLQSPSEAPNTDEGWRFVGQLDSTYSFLVPPTVPLRWITADSERWEGRTHVGEGPNFGDGGVAYLFLRAGRVRPEGLFFWQCV